DEFLLLSFVGGRQLLLQVLWDRPFLQLLEHPLLDITAGLPQRILRPPQVLEPSLRIGRQKRVSRFIFPLADIDSPKDAGTFTIAQPVGKPSEKLLRRLEIAIHFISDRELRGRVD